MPTKLDSES